jgi:hypothetical protein
MSTNGRKPYEQKRKQKKKNPRERHERKPRQNTNESIHSNPQKYVKAWETLG